VTPAEIVKKLERLRTDRTGIEGIWQAIEMFIRPYGGKFFENASTEQSIEWRRRNIYDSTAVKSHNTLASSLHGILTSPVTRWFMLQFRDDELMQDHDAAVWLENASLAVFDELQDSNFNLEINETYLDLTTWGTSFLMEEPVADIGKPWEGVTFSSCPVKECFFEQDHLGRPLTFFRHMEWEASRLIGRFGSDNVPEAVNKAFSIGSDEKFGVAFAVWPRNTSRKGAVLRPSHRPYAWRYVFMRDKTPLGPEGGYYEFPVFVPRWETSSESRWGHSPAFIALADVLTLNQLVELVLMAGEKVVDPTVLMSERSGFTDLNLGAGEVNVGRDITDVGIRSFESGARFDVSQLRIEDLRAAIRGYFFVDDMQMKDSPAMTAAEVHARYELMHRSMSGPMSRLKTDLLDLIVERTFKLMLRAGQLGDVPEIIRSKMPSLDIQYLSPLARAQHADQTAALERYILIMAQAANLRPDALDTVDFDKFARTLARSLNVPTTVTLSERAVNDARQQKQQMAERSVEATVRTEEAEAVTAEATAENALAAEEAIV